MLASPSVRAVDELTPIEYVDGIAYKRDDLFRPFDDVPLSGGKVRQAMELLRPRAAAIKSEQQGLVLTATSVHSPQGLIIARVAYEYGLRTRLYIGASSPRTAVEHAMLRTALRYRCSLDCTARVAYDGALLSAMRGRGYGYVVRFGINLEDAPDAILASTSAQAANVPPDVRTVVIPTGSGITAAGVIMGLPDSVERAIVVQIAGFDRTKLIRRLTARSFEHVADKRYAYSKLVRRRAGSITLDPVYEAKAHDWMLRELQLRRDGSTLFWLVGDSTPVRRAAAHR